MVLQLGHILIKFQLKLFSCLFIRFVPVNLSQITGDDEVLITCHQNSVLFCLSSFQYILLAVAFAKGVPYRQPLFKNCEYSRPMHTESVSILKKYCCKKCFSCHVENSRNTLHATMGFNRMK